MDQKYAAIIMKRQSLRDGDYVFYCDHAVVGDYDEETMTFTDSKGSVYVSMMSPYVLKSKDNYYYYFLLNLKDYEDIYQLQTDGNLSLFLREFDGLSRRKFFYLGKDPNGKYSFITLDKDKIYQDNGFVSRGSFGSDYRYGDHYTLDLELQQLQGEVYDERYTSEELKSLIEKLQESEKDIHGLVKIIRNYALDEPVEALIEEKKVSNESPEKINIDELFQKVTRTLIAQDEPARRVITEIARKEMDARKKKEGILLTGSTGIGKTELMRLIAKYIDRPFFKVDSTQLTMPGYVGKDIEEVLWDLYESCGCDLEKTEKAIIFFDEIDKKGSSQKSDVSGQGVLNLLLPFIEGSTYDACRDTKYAVDKVKISTDNMIVILGGAYTDVYKNVAKNNFGFLGDDSSHSKDRDFSTKNFVEYGLMTNEFMSRVTVIRLNELDVDSIKRIMLESDESAMRIQQNIFEKLGVRLTFTDGYTTSVAKNAFEKKTGARGLNGIIDESTWRVFEEVYSHPDIYDEAILDEETLENPCNYQLVKKM